LGRGPSKTEVEPTPKGGKGRGMWEQVQYRPNRPFRDNRKAVEAKVPPNSTASSSIGIRIEGAKA